MKCKINEDTKTEEQFEEFCKCAEKEFHERFSGKIITTHLKNEISKFFDNLSKKCFSDGYLSKFKIITEFENNSRICVKFAEKTKTTIHIRTKRSNIDDFLIICESIEEAERTLKAMKFEQQSDKMWESPSHIAFMTKAKTLEQQKERVQYGMSQINWKGINAEDIILINNNPRLSEWI